MIFWNPDEVALTLGPLTFRWYAVCLDFLFQLFFFLLFAFQRVQAFFSNCPPHVRHQPFAA